MSKLIVSTIGPASSVQEDLEKLAGLRPDLILVQIPEAEFESIKAHPALGWLRWLVEIGALIGLSSVVLVMIIAQPRIRSSSNRSKLKMLGMI